MKSLLTLIYTITTTILFAQSAEVYAVHETDEVISYNSADDPAIYLHSINSDSSFFIGTDKSTNGRLELYNMDGSRFWTTPAGKSLNNVDVMYGFPLGNDTIDIVGASNRSNNRLEIYTVDEGSRTLLNITGSTTTGLSALYGFIFYKDVCNNKYYAFLTLKNSSGFVYQYELTDSGNGTIDATLVRQILNLPTRTEGMSADQILGKLYIAEEAVGVWIYDADPLGGSARTLLDTIAPTGHLMPSVEGITIYYATDTTGYILVCSQGISTYHVYDRTNGNAYLGEFTITAGTLPAAYKADGIDVLSFPISSTYPNGVFITHDNALAGQYTNYMTVPWESIADSLNLEISLTLNPRNIGDHYCNPVETNSIEVAKNNFSLIVSPNPFSENVNITWNDATINREITILNSVGRIVLKRWVSKNELLDLSALNSGIYYIYLNSQVFKIIKTN